MSDWNPEQYEIFERERAQPFHDLVATIERRPGMRIVDLGCGAGRLTATLAETFDALGVLGVDNSPAMLKKAAAHASERVSFEQGDIATWHAAGGRDAGPFDLVFSNAALHWVPDHDALFAALAELVAAGGQLAVQMPSNFEHPSSAVATALAREAPFAEALGGRARGGGVDPPTRYAERLYTLGFRRQSVQLRVYLHELPGPEAVHAWTRGSTLTWYASQLGPDLYAAFDTAYRERLLAALPNLRPYAFTFQRLLIWASR